MVKQMALHILRDYLGQNCSTTHAHECVACILLYDYYMRTYVQDKPHLSGLQAYNAVHPSHCVASSGGGIAASGGQTFDIACWRY